MHIKRLLNVLEFTLLKFKPKFLLVAEERCIFRVYNTRFTQICLNRSIHLSSFYMDDFSDNHVYFWRRACSPENLIIINSAFLPKHGAP